MEGDCSWRNCRDGGRGDLRGLVWTLSIKREETDLQSKQVKGQGELLIYWVLHSEAEGDTAGPIISYKAERPHSLTLILLQSYSSDIRFRFLCLNIILTPFKLLHDYSFVSILSLVYSWCLQWKWFYELWSAMIQISKTGVCITPSGRALPLRWRWNCFHGATSC